MVQIIKFILTFNNFSPLIYGCWYIIEIPAFNLYLLILLFLNIYDKIAKEYQRSLDYSHSDEMKFHI